MTSYLAGDILTADALNLRPFFHGYQVTAQTVANSGWYPITLTGEVVDTINGHSTTVNTSRYTPSVPGLYFCTGMVTFANAAVGKFCAMVRRNAGGDYGAKYNSTYADNTSVANTCLCASTLRCNGTTDYVELQTYHLFGGATNTMTFTSDYGSFLICQWVGP